MNWKWSIPSPGSITAAWPLRGLILAKPNPYGEAQYFRIYKISRPINGQVTVNAQHISYDLSGIPVGPCKALNAVDALQQLKSHAAVSCDYQFWTDIQTVADFAVAVPGSLRSRWAAWRAACWMCTAVNTSGTTPP